MSEFQLHPQLVVDTVPVESLAFCDLLLMNDAQYPWLILVPRRADVSEMLDLEPSARQQLWNEIDLAAATLRECFGPDKLNIAALGNMVPQLHVHVIARFSDDAAWPKPVWGASIARPYGDAELAARLAILRAALAEECAAS